MDEHEKELRDIWTAKGLNKEEQDRLLIEITNRGRLVGDVSTTFCVTWKIDVSADSAREAAEEAWTSMRRPDSIANVFTMKDGCGVETTIELQN